MEQHNPILLQNSGLGRIPGELRNEIYALLIPSRVRPRKQNTDPAKPPRNQLVTVIAQVNRAIRSEVLPVYYSTVTLATSKSRLNATIVSIGEAGRKGLLHLEINLSGSPVEWEGVRKLEILTSLRSLTTLTFTSFVVSNYDFNLMSLLSSPKLADIVQAVFEESFGRNRNGWWDLTQLVRRVKSMKKIQINPRVGASGVLPEEAMVARLLEETMLR